MVTSQSLSSGTVTVCWALAVGLLASGIAATFANKPGAAAATMLALGGLLAFVAMMRRIPLRLEVAGTKLDAAYPPDDAYQAGRSGGVQAGLEAAVRETEKASQSGRTVEELLDRLRQEAREQLDVVPLAPPGEREVSRSRRVVAGRGYRASTASRVAEVTYRQLDYWARTGLVEPSVQNGEPAALYSLEDIVLLAIVKRLLNAGVSLQQIRQVVSVIRAEGLDASRGRTLISNGQDVILAATAGEVASVLEHGDAIFGVALGAAAADVESKLDALQS
ncbi:MAG: hypothetical protein BGO37_12950 [Cellulomonas sp. 73-92]|nr:MAG: hypothetical protein BGO37_12950 [Cellulomonas sp. 73-92]